MSSRWVTTYQFLHLILQPYLNNLSVYLCPIIPFDFLNLFTTRNPFTTPYYDTCPDFACIVYRVSNMEPIEIMPRSATEWGNIPQIELDRFEKCHHDFILRERAIYSLADSNLAWDKASCAILDHDLREDEMRLAVFRMGPHKFTDMVDMLWKYAEENQRRVNFFLRDTEPENVTTQGKDVRERRSQAALDLCSKGRAERLDIIWSMRLVISELTALHHNSRQKYSQAIEDVCRRAAERVEGLVWFHPKIWWHIEYLFTIKWRNENAMAYNPVERPIHKLAAMTVSNRAAHVVENRLTENYVFNTLMDSGAPNKVWNPRQEFHCTVRLVTLMHSDLAWFWGPRNGNIKILKQIRLLPWDKEPASTIFESQITYDEVKGACSEEKLTEIIHLMRKWRTEANYDDEQLKFFGAPESVDISSLTKRRKIGLETLTTSDVANLSHEEMSEYLKAFIQSRKTTEEKDNKRYKDDRFNDKFSDDYANITLLTGLTVGKESYSEPGGWYFLPEELRPFLTQDIGINIPRCPKEPTPTQYRKLSVPVGVLLHDNPKAEGEISTITATMHSTGGLQYWRRGRSVTGAGMASWISLPERKRLSETMMRDQEQECKAHLKRFQEGDLAKWQHERKIWEIEVFLLCKAVIGKVCWSTKADVNAIIKATRESLMKEIDESFVPDFIKDQMDLMK